MLLDYCCRCCGFTLIKRHGAFSLKTTPSETWVRRCLTYGKVVVVGGGVSAAQVYYITVSVELDVLFKKYIMYLQIHWCSRQH